MDKKDCDKNCTGPWDCECDDLEDVEELEVLVDLYFNENLIGHFSDEQAQFVKELMRDFVKFYYQPEVEAEIRILQIEVERLREKLRWRNQVHEKHVNELVKQLYDKQGSNKRDS